MKFEYKAFNEKLSEEQLNTMGEEGWELIVHRATAVAIRNELAQYYVFKREKLLIRAQE